MTTKRGHTPEQVEQFSRRVARHMVLEFLAYSKWAPISFSVLPVRVDPAHVNRIKRADDLLVEFKWSEIPPKMRPLVGTLIHILMEEAGMAELAMKVAHLELRTNEHRRAAAPRGIEARKDQAKRDRRQKLDGIAALQNEANLYRKLHPASFKKDIRAWLSERFGANSRQLREVKIGPRCKSLSRPDGSG